MPRPQLMSQLQRCLVKGRPTKKKLIKFAHEKVIKSKWRAELAKEDQKPPKLVWGLAARYLHSTFACERRIIESSATEQQQWNQAVGTQTSRRLQKQLMSAPSSFFEEIKKKKKCLDVAKTGGTDRHAGGEAPVRRPDQWRSSCYIFSLLTRTKTSQRGQLWGDQTEIFLFSAGSRPPLLPPLPLTHQVFRSPRLVNRHLRLNISPVGSVCLGGGKKSERYADRSNTSIRASTEIKYNLVEIKSTNVQSDVYCYCFY